MTNKVPRPAGSYRSARRAEAKKRKLDWRKFPVMYKKYDVSPSVIADKSAMAARAKSGKNLKHSITRFVLAPHASPQA